MKISGNDMMLGIQNIQRPNNAQSNFANAKIVTDSGDNAIKADISDTGRRVGHMMGKMGQMRGPKMEARMEEMKSSIDELGLSELDIDSMSEEEIAEVANKINDVMESFKPKGLEGQAIDLDNLSSEDIKAYVSEFKENASGVLDSIGKMEGMMKGRPPMGGKPPAGNQIQNSVNQYNSLDVTSEEDELDMLETLVEALETDESSDDESEITELQQLLGEYLLSKEE